MTSRELTVTTRVVVVLAFIAVALGQGVLPGDVAKCREKRKSLGVFDAPTMQDRVRSCMNEARMRQIDWHATGKRCGERFSACSWLAHVSALMGE